MSECFNFYLNNADKFMELTLNQKKWAERRRYRLSPRRLREMIARQNGRCAFSKVSLLFDTKYGTPTSSNGCHPLYVSIDHAAPGQNSDYQLVCYDLNDLKGHLPAPLFEALIKTKAWKEFIEKWKELVDKGAEIEEYKELIKRGN